MLGITKLESVSLKGFFLISVLLKVSYMEDVTSNPTVPDSTTSSTSLSWNVPQSDVGAGPVVVGNLSVTQVTTSSVSLRWSPPPGNITSYLAEWKEGTTCKNKSTEAPSINITDLTPGTQYTFTVIPILGGNPKSHPVNCSQFTRPNPPRDIKIVEKTNDSISLSWVVPVMGAAAEANYSVACTSRLNPSTQTMLVSQKQVKFSGLTSGTLYNISVGTVGPQDLRSPNVSRNEYTLPNPVQNLKASMKSISSVTLEWESPVGAQSYFEYRVNISSNGSVRSQTTSMNQSNITDLNPGTKYNCSVTTLASNDTYGPPLFTFCQTKPMPVDNLSYTAVNTTAVSLMWSSSDYEENTYYLIFNPRDQTMIQNTTNKSINISDLTPGTSYTIGVKAVVNGVASDPTTISILTKPEKAKNITIIGTTTSLTVTWDRPEGNVTSYIIDIYNGSSRAANQTVFNNSAVFANLKPGRLYSVTLTTLSGPLQGEPQMINCSTYPSPPSFIKVEGATTSSINISWGRPSDMDGDQYAYIVSYQGNEINSTDTCFMLGNLTSGTPYNISVLTVGPMSYKSTPQTVLSCTRVSSVKNLQATEITTSNVTLVWQSPNSGKSYEYFVTAKSPTQVTNFTVNRKDASIRNLQSGSNYTFDVTVMLQGVCESAAESISLFTRPYPIADLKSEAINESVVYLNWTRPQEYQDSYTYTVQISGCTSNTKNQSVQQEQAYIYDLIPGTNCSLLIYSRASNGIEGWPLSTSQYTKLEKVMPAVSNGYKNDSINVTWDPPRGNIEKYVVTLYNPQEQNSTQELNNTARSCLFVNLKAGRMYTVRVRTRSGPFAEESQEVSVATYPNKPGDIIIADKNTSSIALAWSSPLDSDGSTNYYVVKYQSALYNHTIKTNTSSSVLNGLASGTSYNISVATVGPKELESAPVTVDLVTTRPEKVQSLEIQSVSHEKVVLKWSAPPDFKNGYYYGVTTSRTDYVINTTLNETYQVVDLLPGAEYNFSVMTLTLDGTESSHAVVSSCTDAAPVRNIHCQGPDLTPALLEVQWSSPKGLNKGFEINITDKSKETLSNCTSKCTHILKNLSYNTNYTVNILTRGCGNSSPITAASCKTGITVPLIPDIKDYIQVTEVEHDRFTLDLNPGLFSDSEGPIVSYGILVTSSPSSIIGGNSSSLKKYLKTTYEAWNTGNGAAYLATLKGDKEKYQGGKTSIVIGDNTEWGRYINGPLKSKGSYRFAIVMFTRLEKNGEFIDTSKSYVSISPFYDTEINLPENPVVVASIVISIVSILLLISIFIIGAVSLKRRKRPEPSEVPILSMREKASVPIKVEDFKDYFRKQQANSNCGFAKEFENLKSVGVSQAKSSALALENKGKNRYNNVLPYDSSRVKLSIQGSPFDDYINANYIPGYNSRKEFIAAQGPLASTVNEFWRMIWEKNVNTLVMLTRCTEQGRVKCEEYWPSGTKHFSNITVTSTSEIVLDDWTIRDFTVKNVKTAEKRPLRQFHFTAWPDHGVPGTTELLITFRHLVREHMDQFSRHSPSVVHCSAGVGRTGTFIAIDRLIFQIERDNEVDVHGIVHDLRMHRPLMVQTEDQYVFLNQCAMDIVRSRNGTNVDLIYENTAAISIYENFQPMKKSKNGYRHT